MTLETFEGPWEEIQAHIPEFVGHRVRVTVLDDPSTTQSTTPNNSMAKLSPEEAQKRLQAFERMIADPFVDAPPLSAYAVSRESFYDGERL